MASRDAQPDPDLAVRQQLLDGRRAAATRVETERVARIPVDPKTGKHRQVVLEG